MPTEFLFNHRFVYQNEAQADNEPPKDEKSDKRLEASTTIEGSKEFADQQVNKTEKDGGMALENSKMGNVVPNPEFLTPPKLKELALKEPQDFFGSINQLKDNPDFIRLLETAARAAAKDNPSALLSFKNAIKDKSYYPELRKVALTNLADRDPRRACEEPVEPGDSPETRALALANMKRFDHYA